MMKPINEEQYAMRVENWSKTQEWGEQTAWVTEIGALSFGEDVLDFGCNTGLYCESLHNGKFASITGVDANEWAIERAKTLDKKTKYLNYHQWITSSDEPQYDFIMMNHVLGHITQVERVMLKLAAQLRPKGRLVITTPNRKYVNLMSVWNFFKGYKSDPTIEHNWTTKELITMGTALGLAPALAFTVGDYPFGLRLKWLQNYRANTGLVLLKEAVEECTKEKQE